MLTETFTETFIFSEVLVVREEDSDRVGGKEGGAEGGKEGGAEGGSPGPG